MLHHVRLEPDPEERLYRKLRRIFRTSAWSAGLGAGLLLVPLLFSEQAANTNAAFTGAGLTFLVYGLLQLAGLIFAPKHAVKLSLLLTYALMPAALIKLAMLYMRLPG